jgi:tetratricopeptide (TPR) repeat protein
MLRRSLCLFALALLAVLPLHAQTSEVVQVGPPSIRRADPPSATASVKELETVGDELRSEKAFLDALDYYNAALAKDPKNAPVCNKAGIAELQMRRYRESRKFFEHAIKLDPQFADAYNNLGVVQYEEKKYGKAVKLYDKALQLQPAIASYYGNLGAAYYSEKNWEKAGAAYGQALQLDPNIFERSSRTGVAAQLPSPEERAHFDYLLAKLFAKRGDSDRSLHYLQRALEDGYKDINDVYKDPEFEALRSDARFTQLMAARPPAIPE